MNDKVNQIEKVIGFEKLTQDDATFDFAPESYLQATSDFTQTFEITTNLLQAFINKDKQKSKQSANNHNQNIKISKILI